MNLIKELVIDRKGKPKAVILKLSEYKKLISLIEFLEDSLELKKAIKTSTGFIEHKELLKKLKNEGII
jgi:PHD/YefM family antitoxin component YafN of YafNO toxin-antitoxin module